MASFSVVASRVWDLYVTQSILTGLWFTRINTYNSSLLYAWIIFLCDLIYIIDALARASKTNSSRSSWTSSRILSLILSSRGWWTIATSVFFSLKFVTFVPYHVLVILQLEITGLYLVVCALRLARLLKSGRICESLTWSASKLLENGRCVFLVRTEESSSQRKQLIRKEHLLTETMEDTAILKHLCKIKTERERSTFRTQIRKRHDEATENKSLKKRLVL